MPYVQMKDYGPAVEMMMIAVRSAVDERGLLCGLRLPVANPPADALMVLSNGTVDQHWFGALPAYDWAKIHKAVLGALSEIAGVPMEIPPQGDDA